MASATAASTVAGKMSRTSAFIGKAKVALAKVDTQAIIGRVGSLSKASINTTKQVINGPLRSSLMVGQATVSLVLREQGLSRLPELGQWPVAAQKYASLLGRLAPTDRTQPVMGTLRNIGNLTWSQVGSGCGVLAHLTALYYIGQFAGSMIGRPFRPTTA